MKTFVTILFIVCFFLINCRNSKVYKTKEFEINEIGRAFYNTLARQDTFCFYKEPNEKDTFLISSKDSVLKNSNGLFMNERPRKEISIRYRQIPVNMVSKSSIENAGTFQEKVVTSDPILISVTKFPDTKITDIYITFKNFRYSFENKIPVLSKDSLFILKRWYHNVYELETTVPSLVREEDDIEILYFNLTTGILGYKQKSGNYCMRLE